MKNQTPEEKAQKVIAKMDATYRKGAKFLLPNTVGAAVIEMIGEGRPVTNQSLYDHFQSKVESTPDSPIAEYYREALNLLETPNLGS